MGAALVHLGADFDSTTELPIRRWSEKCMVHALECEGVLGARHLTKTDWPGAGTNPRHLILFERADASPLRSAPYPPSLSEEFAPYLSLTHSTYRAIDEPRKGSTRVTGTAILHVTVDVHPQHHDDFLRWYAEEHVPAVLEAPGMLGARRYADIDLQPGMRRPDGRHDYCTLYEMENASVITRPETLAASARGACPDTLQPHRVASNAVYQEVSQLQRNTGT